MEEGKRGGGVRDGQDLSSNFDHAVGDNTDTERAGRSIQVGDGDFQAGTDVGVLMIQDGETDPALARIRAE